ncbi:MAG TPA: SPOR domain-containing protein, partial [bacterium]|nr:SPOR domain-containing protein [bacterium]
PAVTTPETTPAAEAAAPAVTSPVPATKAAPTLVSKPTGRYHLVWNAFSSRRQADKGYAAACRIAGDGQTLPLILAPQRGGRLYRVVVGDYASAAEAAQDLPRQRARFGSALWVLRY